MVNLVGTIDMADPFSSELPPADGLTDEVNFGK